MTKKTFDSYKIWGIPSIYDSRNPLFNDNEPVEVEEYISAIGLDSGITDNLKNKFILMCDMTINEYGHIFDDPFFTKSVSNQYYRISETSPRIKLILPCVRRAFTEFFLSPPSIFTKRYYETGNQSDLRLKLFQEQFNLKEFLIFVKDKLIENINCLDNFPNLDKEPELLRLIVLDYCSSKVENVLSFNGSMAEEIRDIRINKLTNE